MSIENAKAVISANNALIKAKNQEVYNAGKKSEYDEFWDAFQNYGERRNYSPSFGGTGWTDVNFKPKYKLIITNAQSAFGTSQMTDLVAATEHIGGIDFTGCTNFSYAFSWAKTQRLGVIDITNAGNQLTSTFANNSKLKSIEKIIVSTSNVFQSSTFTKCTALEEIRFEGIIASNISFADCSLLSIESMWNIVEHLADFSATDPATETGKYQHTITFSNEAWQRLMQDSATPYGILEARKWNLTTVV